MVLDFSQDNTLSQSRRKILRLTSRKIFKPIRFWVNMVKNFKFRGSIASMRDPKLVKTKICQFFHISALYFEYSSTNISLLLLFEFRSAIPKIETAVFGLPLKTGELMSYQKRERFQENR